jgi:branched-chain amino acid transport system substrate-binding protein
LPKNRFLGIKEDYIQKPAFSDDRSQLESDSINQQRIRLGQTFWILPRLNFFMKPRRLKMNVRRFTKFAFVLAIIALIAGLSACDQIQQLLVPAPPDMEDVSAEIPIGVVVALTGRFADEIGIPMHNGFELARAEINHSRMLGGAKITFITEDDQSVSSVEALNKLIHQDGVSAITGLAISGQAIHSFPIAQENGVVCFSSVSSASGLSAIGDFIFRASLTVDRMVPVGVATTREKLGYQRVAVLYDRIDLYSQSGYEALTEAFADNGVEVVATETFETGDTDFSAQLTRIEALDPDAVFVSALSPEMTLILIQGRDLGTSFIILEMTIDEVKAAGAAAEGAITFTSWIHTASTPGNQAFVQKYEETYGQNPNPWAAQSYAAVYILAEAIGDAQSKHPTAIRDAMANIMDFDTVLGQFSFDVVGDAVYNPIILIVDNGQFQVFE